MAKKLLEVNTFSGGLNTYSDARDIKDNEFAQSWNAIVDQTGIIRAGGMGVEGIETDFADNTNFQKGFGLFQFSTDYAISDIVGSTFSNGITKGTIAAYTSTTVFTLEDKPTTSSSNDYYNNMIIFIYSGTGVGESRLITDYVGSTRAVTTEAFATTLHDKDDATPSKYIIYPWKLDGSLWSGQDEVVKKDFITNGRSISMYYGINLPQSGYSGFDNYFIFSKDTAADDATVNLGYIEYGSSLTIVPGVQYNFSFDCSANQKWTNIICDGNEDGSTSSNYGEKPSWVQLYSTDVEDTSGCVRTKGSNPTPGDWTNGTYHNVEPIASSGGGTGAQFTIVVGSNNPTFYFTEHRGSGYVANEVLTFEDPLSGGSGTNAVLTITAVNHVGLTLQSNGSWLSTTNNSNYITNVNSNYIDNGDFADGTPDTDSDGTDAVAWRLRGTDFVTEEVGGTITSSAAMKYDGHDGSCFLRRTSISGGYDTADDQFSNNHMYQTITLDDMTHYHLNFQYSTSGRIFYSIYDATDSISIKSWTQLGNTKPQNELWTQQPDFQYRYGGWEPSTLSEDNHYAMNYIPFFVSKSKTGTTKNIEIRFTTLPLVGISYDVFLTGVTVFKAHNDLTTMSYNAGGNNPFFDSVTNLSRYNMSFTLPQSYSEVSTWVLRLHAGQHGYRASNTISNTASKSVHFDNISLISSDVRLTTTNDDTITLLTDNRSDGSTISLYSNYSGYWITDVIKWSGIESRPNFNYINGMLKISDGNFKNNNSNKLMYYSKDDTSYSKADVGWVVKDYSIATPPSISIHNVNEGMESTDVFDAIPYLNNFFKGITRLSSPNDPADEHDLGWRMDVFGPGTLPESHGLLIRYYGDEDSLAPAGGKYSIGYENNDSSHNWKDGNPQQLYLMTTDWFYDNIIDENGNPSSQNNHYDSIRDNNTYGVPAAAAGGSTGVNQADIIQSYGWNPTYGWPADQGTSYGHGKQHMAILYDSFINPQNGVDYPLDGFSSFFPENTSIRRVELEIRYNQSGRIHTHYLYDTALPYFTVKTGYMSEGGTMDDYPTSLNRIRNGTFSDADFGQLVSYYTDPRPDFHNIGWKGSKSGSGINGLEEGHTYDDYNRIKSAVVGYTNNVSQWELTFDAIFNYEQIYEHNTAKTQDGFFVELEERISDPDNQNDVSWGAHAGHISIPAGTGTGLTGTTVPNGSESISATNSPDIHMWATFFINKFRIYFYDEEWINETAGESSVASNEVKINYSFGTPEIPSLGWGGRTYKAAVSCVNVFDEESSLNVTDSEIGKNNLGELFIKEGDAPSVDLRLGNGVLNDSFIKKTKIYMQSSESEIWYLQFYIDHKTKKIHSTTSNYSQIGSVSSTNYSTLYNINKNDLKDFNEVSSYESETMVPQDDGIVSNNGNLTCRYKTSVVANNRLYVGNIYHNGRVYEDRMLKSPIGKYNILPQSNFIDVAINDGDSITALAYYKDKILQFKKGKVFVINISGDYEFLEDTFGNVGVQKQSAVVTTPHGIVWANKKGCYIYNGEKLENLIDNKIASSSEYTYVTYNYWYSSGAVAGIIDNLPIVGYMENEDVLLVRFNSVTMEANNVPEGATYHFPTKSWAFVARAFGGNVSTVGETKTGNLSNMITNKDGDILYYIYEPSVKQRILKWQHSSTSHADGANIFFFTTKDFTFGNIAVRKKIYKVYVTYKSNESDTNVVVEAAINGTGSFGVLFDANSKFKDGSACYTGSSLQGTSDVWKTAELKFATPSEVNKVYSIQFRLYSLTGKSDFKINDISISYKVKSVK